MWDQSLSKLLEVLVGEFSITMAFEFQDLKAGSLSGVYSFDKREEGVHDICGCYWC